MSNRLHGRRPHAAHPDLNECSCHRPRPGVPAPFLRERPVSPDHLADHLMPHLSSFFARCRLSGPLCLLLGCCCCRPLSGWPLLTTRGRISRPADGRGIGGDSATVAVGPNCRSSRCWCQPLTYTRRYAVRRSGDWRRVGAWGVMGRQVCGALAPRVCVRRQFIRLRHEHDNRLR